MRSVKRSMIYLVKSLYVGKEQLETNDIDSLISLILEKFESAHPKKEKKTDGHIDVSEQLAKLLEVQKLPTTTKAREYTEEERQIREQILAQYSQTEVEDVDAYCSDEDTEGSNVALAANSLTGIERNTNFQDVMALQKEKREQARLDSAAKKQKDKEDRERQKQLREEKKEKRKTVKGERRR
ncbi:coiled-coil domain-containing protein 43 isoform X2 [Bactrocera neohumeralis]|uniref:coiled-coil domain-containing protein 43 isoform X2 n=1 Tax=Bactrocera tryoni TaxID=59916 RepID=UPI001A96E70A|nr:coiled-coil domain-containing protein 43 isoform X2 [Bactrocera tryoni]XP_050340101.1 coiled-coil domain-containing protein 43 isoform X2 [Bactrocera neohumeralis]